MRTSVYIVKYLILVEPGHCPITHFYAAIAIPPSDRPFLRDPHPISSLKIVRNRFVSYAEGITCVRSLVADLEAMGAMYAMLEIGSLSGRLSME